MHSIRRMVALAVAAAMASSASLSCTCPPRPVNEPAATAGSAARPGSGSPVATATAPCEAVRSRIQQLYRAEAQQKEPKRVEESVADNTTMVMNDCAKQPHVAVPCISRAASVSELEQRCLVALDDEGREGEQ